MVKKSKNKKEVGKIMSPETWRGDHEWEKSPRKMTLQVILQIRGPFMSRSSCLSSFESLGSSTERQEHHHHLLFLSKGLDVLPPPDSGDAFPWQEVLTSTWRFSFRFSCRMSVSLTLKMTYSDKDFMYSSISSRSPFPVPVFRSKPRICMSELHVCSHPQLSYFPSLVSCLSFSSLKNLYFFPEVSIEIRVCHLLTRFIFSFNSKILIHPSCLLCWYFLCVFRQPSISLRLQWIIAERVVLL